MVVWQRKCLRTKPEILLVWRGCRVREAHPASRWQWGDSGSVRLLGALGRVPSSAAAWGESVLVAGERRKRSLQHHPAPCLQMEEKQMTRTRLGGKWEKRLSGTSMARSCISPRVWSLPKSCWAEAVTACDSEVTGTGRAGDGCSCVQDHHGHHGLMELLRGAHSPKIPS